jgi:hypothetical protein
MQRSWVWVLALGTSLIAPNPIYVVDAATSSSGPQKVSGIAIGHPVPLIEIAQGHPAGSGGGRGPSGAGGGGPHGPVGGGAFMRGGGGPPGGGGPHGPVGGGAFMRGGGGPPGGGGRPHIVTPGGAGGRFLAPRVGTGPNVVSPGRGARIVAPYGRRASGVVHGTPRFTPRPGVVARSGAHYPRYRHRRGRFRYYYGGWWYAYPWWAYYGTSCTYRARECAYRWGWRTRRYYACLRYYGCY